MTLKNFFLDIFLGIKKYNFWMTYGINDIKTKYRRTKLGQWWITLSVALFLFIIGGFFKGAFYADFDVYLAYLSVGYISWLFMQDCVNGGCNILIQSKSFLLQKSWPVSIFIFRFIYKEIIIFLHHVILLVPIFLWLGYSPGMSSIVLSLCGLILTIFTAIWVSLFLSIICLKYRDLPLFIQSLMRMAFFATPIIWIDRNIGRIGELMILYNPFTYFIKIIRDPLLGYGFPSEAWIIAIIISITCFFISLTALLITKNKLNYWL